jgi:integrase
MLVMPKIRLNEKKVAKLMSKPAAKHKVYWDQTLPGFGIRLRSEGARTYVAGGRFGGEHYRPLEIGDARKMEFETAKAKAREWLAFDAEGKDPRVVASAKEREAARRRAHSFASIAEAFVTEAVIGPNQEKPLQRRWREVRRQTGILVAKWGQRSIHDIHRDELVRFIKDRAKSAPAETRNLLGVAKQLFGWARDQDYGLETNVAADVRPGRIIGPKVTRERALSTDEIRTLWAKVSAMPYPYGPAYQLLILTGLRLNECVQARRGEIDLKAKVWTVPASRMKGKRPHKVPLTPRMIAIFEELPKISGDCVFSTTGGELPISLGSKIKDQLDAELKFEESWQNHDLRRSIRSGLAELGVSDVVAEAVLAHRQPGILAVYNKHPYLDERRDALERWGDVVAPHPM